MQTALVILGLLIVAAGIYIFMAASKMKNAPMVQDHEKIMVLTDKNFQHQTKNKLVLVDFWAAWCAPCRMMAPILNDIANELDGDLHVGKINIEQYQSLAQKFKVRNIPTLVLFKNGQEIKRFVGIKSKDFLLKQMKSA
jgi:thioredoxin 1